MIIYKIIYAINKCVRTYTSKVNPLQNLDAIQMSYSSYETTTSSTQHLPLIIMHGLFGSKGNWNSLCKPMQQKTQRKIFSVDARNHGDSPHSFQHSYANLVEDLKLFMNQFRIKKSALLGHSMGGRAMMLFALKNANMVEKLLVVDISPIGTSPSFKLMPTIFEYLLQVKLPTSGTMSIARKKVDQELAKKIHDKAMRSFLLTNLIQKGDGTYSWRVNLEAIISNFTVNLATFPKTNDMSYNGPTLFVCGEKSDYVPTIDHPEILKLFPNAKFEYIKGSGHWPHSEKPKEFLKLSEDFINK